MIQESRSYNHARFTIQDEIAGKWFRIWLNMTRKLENSIRELFNIYRGEGEMNKKSGRDGANVPAGILT
ncbi:MAG: hypothetical protein AB1598_12160 [Thermodesulfobacteriota bacterium]